MSPFLSIKSKGVKGDFGFDFDLKAPLNGVTSLFGPSGAGKSTLLRIIAGLERYPGASLSLGDQVWQDQDTFLPPHKRPIGYVFQDARLFEHLNVEKNLAFAYPETMDDITLRWPDIVARLDLEPLLNRNVASLSGGERQRIALGRALLSQPSLLLLDEPLSALDKDNRNRILPYLADICTDLNLPVIHVSHDRYEVEQLADNVALMDSGRITDFGPIRDIATNPRLALAKQRDARVTLSADILDRDEDHGLLTLNVSGNRLHAPVNKPFHGESMRLGIAASDVSVSRSKASDSSILNILPAQIESVTEEEGALCLLVLKLEAGDISILSRISSVSRSKLNLSRGDRVFAQIKAVALFAD